MIEGLRRLPEIAGVQLRLAEVSGTGPVRPTLLGILSEDERARFERFKVEGARLSFLVSRGFLRITLAEVLGCAPERLQFGEGAHGKPFLAGAHADSGLEFNVSHSGDLVLLAYTHGRVLGVDVERKRPDREFAKLAGRFFAPDEARKLLAAADSLDFADSFYRCWTRKEAYLKAKGTGLTTRLDSFEVTFLPDETPAMLHTEVAGEDPASWSVHPVPVPIGYEAALVVHR